MDKAFVFLGILLSSCALLEDKEAERTYPQVSSFELVSIPEFNSSVPLPGSYNIRGYVVTVNECPEEANCIFADGIAVSSRNMLDPRPDQLEKEGIYIAAEKPSQFQPGARYEFSLKVDHERVPEASWPFAQILGYDRIR